MDGFWKRGGRGGVFCRKYFWDFAELESRIAEVCLDSVASAYATLVEEHATRNKGLYRGERGSQCGYMVEVPKRIRCLRQ